MRWGWGFFVAGLVAAVTLGSVTREMRSAYGVRTGDLGSVDGPRAARTDPQTAAQRQLQLLDDIMLQTESSVVIGTAPQSITESEALASAISAAPPAIASDAAVASLDPGAGVHILRPGSAEFTCVPDNPATPEPDPMCLDANALRWAVAWWAGRTPSGNDVGMGYMPDHGGGDDAAPPEPHLMIVNAPALLLGHPNQPADGKRPYVMWADTPYAHLMIPLENTVQLARATAP